MLLRQRIFFMPLLYEDKCTGETERFSCAHIWNIHFLFGNRYLTTKLNMPITLARDVVSNVTVTV